MKCDMIGGGEIGRKDIKILYRYLRGEIFGDFYYLHCTLYIFQEWVSFLFEYQLDIMMLITMEFWLSAFQAYCRIEHPSSSTVGQSHILSSGWVANGKDISGPGFHCQFKTLQSAFPAPWRHNKDGAAVSLAPECLPWAFLLPTKDVQPEQGVNFGCLGISEIYR